MAFRRILVVVLVLVVAAGICAAWLHHVLWGARTPRAVELEITAGTPARQILSDLQTEGLLPSPTAARIYLRFRAGGRSLHYGHYVFAADSRPAGVLEQLLDGRVKMFTVRVVEGQRAATIAEHFESQGVGSAAQWEDLISKTDWIATIAPEAPSLEGFLFPDTYRFAVGISAEAAVQHMVDRFDIVWLEETAENGALWGSPLEVVTLASLVEAETSVASERARIAGVFLNRLRRGMLLQCDPTVVYALQYHQQWRGRLLRKDLEIDDPYNTYRYPGLPPGPINSPGRAALAAALQPEATSFLYFVASPDGGHTFSRTLGEHNRAVARLRHARR